MITNALPIDVQGVPIFGGDVQTWVLAVAVMLVALIVGRFVHSFRNGSGIVGAWKAVVFGTNTPTPAVPLTPTVVSTVVPTAAPVSSVPKPVSKP